eukprot:g4119.t1
MDGKKKKKNKKEKRGKKRLSERQDEGSRGENAADDIFANTVAFGLEEEKKEDKKQRKDKRSRRKKQQDRIEAAKAKYHSSSEDEEAEAGEVSSHSRKSAISSSNGEMGGLDKGSSEKHELGGFGGGLGFAGAIQKLLDQDPSGSVSAPVLSRRKTPNMKRLAEARAAEKKAKVRRLEKIAKVRVGFREAKPGTDLYEQELRKIATRGVVALFNAVSKAQAGARRTESGKESKPIDKEGFMQILQGTEDESTRKTESARSRKWDVLQDNFDMGGSRIRHWDEENSDSSSSDAEQLSEGDKEAEMEVEEA